MQLTNIQVNHQYIKVSAEDFDKAMEVIEELGKRGFDACILKGKGNYTYYEGLTDNPSLGFLRTCGDIDAWIWPKKPTRHPVKSIIDYCKEKHILVSLCHLHAEVKPIDGVPVEIHFRPSFLNARWRDKAFQKIFRKAQFVRANIDGCGEILKRGWTMTSSSN